MITKLTSPKFSPNSQRQMTPAMIGEISQGMKKITRATDLPLLYGLTSR